MTYKATLNLFGTQRVIPAKYAGIALAVGLPALAIIFGWLAYLVLETVDHYLGTSKVGAAILLFILLVRVTANDRVYALLPLWANNFFVNFLPALTAATLYQQGRMNECYFVLAVLATAAINKSVTAWRKYRKRIEESELERARGTVRAQWDVVDVPFEERKK
jgi:putative effector of murein hydrolase LrgA (UPF0299 family)